MNPNRIFFLHIKKSGGTSLRSILSNHYMEQEDRYTSPASFIALPKDQWNDTLNNYRIPLGRYDYKRMQFAKKFLYSQEEFDEMFKFTVVRNPYDRIVSCWKYIVRNNFFDYKYFRMKNSFTYFLEALPEFMKTRYMQIYHLGYIGLHAAPVWPDITDDNGIILVDKIIKIENLTNELEKISKIYNLDLNPIIRTNRSDRKEDYRQYYNNKRRELCEKIYSGDIESLGYTF